MCTSDYMQATLFLPWKNPEEISWQSMLFKYLRFLPYQIMSIQPFTMEVDGFEIGLLNGSIYYV